MNKIILSTLDFPYPITITACHFLTNSVFIKVMEINGVFHMKKIPLQPIVNIAILNAGAMALMNYSLQVNSVAVYQMFKLLNIPFSAFVYASFLGRNDLNLSIFISLVIIFIGALCVVLSSSISILIAKNLSSSVTNITTTKHVWNLMISVFKNFNSINYVGLIVGFVSCFVTIINQIYTGEIMKKYNLSGVQNAHLIMLPQSFFALMLSFYYEKDAFFLLKGRIINYIDDESQVFSDNRRLLPIYILATCFIALGINILTPWIIKRTSSTTYNVVGVTKTTLIIVIGYVYFKTYESMSNLRLNLEVTGVIISLIGISLYFTCKSMKATQMLGYKKKKN